MGNGGTSMSARDKGGALTRGEVDTLADHFRSLLSMIEAGELDASTAMRYRLEGAIAALDVALGRPSSLLDDLGNLPS